jgi:hypothetical protein
MKMASIVVAGLGVLALVLGLVDRLFQAQILHLTSGGYLRGATVLYLLALVIMVFDHNYCTKSEAAPATKS